MSALRVMVVDDDDMVGTLIADMLEDMGFDVCAIEASEADAVAAAARCKPELMIVDARLGQGSGVAAMQKITRSGGPVPHVFISGQRVVGVGEDAIVLQKPFRELDLARAIERALSLAEN